MPKGSVYGLVGPNGAGKSTFLRHAAGIYKQDSGSLLIDGQPIFENTAVKSKISYIPDDLFFFIQASQRDMMKFYKGIYPNFNTERYEKLKEVFKLDEKTPIRKFSKGMQKQSAFWLSLCMMPDLLLLDEPAAGMNPHETEDLVNTIKFIRDNFDMTILLIEHDMKFVAGLCDEVTVLNFGTVLAEGDTKSALNDPEVIKAYIGG